MESSALPCMCNLTQPLHGKHQAINSKAHTALHAAYLQLRLSYLLETSIK